MAKAKTTRLTAGILPSKFKHPTVPAETEKYHPNAKQGNDHWNRVKVGLKEGRNAGLSGKGMAAGLVERTLPCMCVKNKKHSQKCEKYPVLMLTVLPQPHLPILSDRLILF